jgi:NAD(P)-dependent dehydrogenase (short-subunit alcohol dehydrogenase family)
MRFQDKVAIVTGGGSGIGKEVATRFVAEGGSVVVNGRDAAKTESAARKIDPTGKRVAVQTGDIALPATGETLVKTAIDRFGRLDVLFNNAGIFAPKPFLEVTEAEYDRFVDIILKGKFFAAQAAAKEGLRPWRRDCADRLDVGAAGDRRDAFVCVFGGEWGGACAGQESRDRAGARQDPRERDCTRCDRDAGVQHVPDA